MLGINVGCGALVTGSWVRKREMIGPESALLWSVMSVSLSPVNMRSGLLGYMVIVIFVGVFTVYYFYDVSNRNQESKIDDLLGSLRSKDVQQWTQEDIALFMMSREEVYSQRREKIRQKCSQNTVRVLNKLWLAQMSIKRPPLGILF